MELEGPSATDPLVAQWAETVTLKAVGQFLQIASAVAAWHDELWCERGTLLEFCGDTVEELLAGTAG